MCTYIVTYGSNFLFQSSIFYAEICNVRFKFLREERLNPVKTALNTCKKDFFQLRLITIFRTIIR